MKAGLLTLSILLILLASCNKDFLDKSPKDSLSPEVFYSDANNLQSALSGVYNALQVNSFFGGSLVELDAITDNGLAINSNEVTDFINFGLGNINANTTGKIADIYKAAYQVIQRANLLIENVNVPGSIPATLRTTVEYEARALRALAYMRLVYLFDAVPLVTKSLTRAESITLTSATHADIIAFILKEWEEAAAHLGSKPYNNQLGRFTSIAALGFRAKALTFEARKGNRPWAEALTALKAMTTLAEQNGVKLFVAGNGSDGQQTFEKLFQLAAENSPEILFAVKANKADPIKSVFTYYTPAGSILEFCIHTNLVKDFYTTDGLPITDPASIYDPANPYQQRDPRLKASIVVPGSQYSNGIQLLTFPGKIVNARLLTDFAVRKTGSLDGVEPNRGELDAIVLRYADVLLLLAEAENEVNGPATAAYDAVNKVRTRVNMPGVKAGLTKDQFRAEIIHERRVELAFEGHRWYDLTTLGMADKVINAIGEFNRAFVPNKQELFPIPQSEIDLNPTLNQNPGYKK